MSQPPEGVLNRILNAKDAAVYVSQDIISMSVDMRFVVMFIKKYYPHVHIRLLDDFSHHFKNCIFMDCLPPDNILKGSPKRTDYCIFIMDLAPIADCTIEIATSSTDSYTLFFWKYLRPTGVVPCEIPTMIQAIQSTRYYSRHTVENAAYIRLLMITPPRTWIDLVENDQIMFKTLSIHRNAAAAIYYGSMRGPDASAPYILVDPYLQGDPHCYENARDFFKLVPLVSMMSPVCEYVAHHQSTSEYRHSTTYVFYLVENMKNDDVAVFMFFHGWMAFGCADYIKRFENKYFLGPMPSVYPNPFPLPHNDVNYM